MASLWTPNVRTGGGFEAVLWVGIPSRRHRQEEAVIRTKLASAWTALLRLQKTRRSSMLAVACFGLLILAFAGTTAALQPGAAPNPTSMPTAVVAAATPTPTATPTATAS